MGKLSNLIKYANEFGLPVPMARDSVINKPSVTLLFMYVANLGAIASLIYLHLTADSFVATSMSILYAVISTVLYLMRKLQKAKFDLKDKDFELDSGDAEKQ